MEFGHKMIGSCSTQTGWRRVPASRNPPGWRNRRNPLKQKREKKGLNLVQGGGESDINVLLNKEKLDAFLHAARLAGFCTSKSLQQAFQILQVSLCREGPGLCKPAGFLAVFPLGCGYGPAPVFQQRCPVVTPGCKASYERSKGPWYLWPGLE